MNIKGFLDAIASVSSTWTIAAYSIAAVLAVLNAISSRRKRTPANSVIWGVVVVICVLGLAPTIANAYLERLKIVGAVYRVRTVVVDAQHVPISGATLRTTASNETTQTDQGIGQVSIPRATMPGDGKVTIYADLDSEFLHGHADIQLAEDLNPSITIEVKAVGNAVVSGLVEDNAGHALAGAAVSVLGGESTITSANGAFTVKTNSPLGQQVRLHVEKAGYQPIDQDHPAGREPATIVLLRTTKSRFKR